MTTMRRRLDRLARHVEAGRRSAAPPMGGRLHTGPEHVAEVVAALIDCGAWTVGDVAERVGLSAAELRDFLGGAPAGEW